MCQSRMIESDNSYNIVLQTIPYAARPRLSCSAPFVRSYVAVAAGGSPGAAPLRQRAGYFAPRQTTVCTVAPPPAKAIWQTLSLADCRKGTHNLAMWLIGGLVWLNTSMVLQGTQLKQNLEPTHR